MLTTKNWDANSLSLVLGCLGVVLLGGCTPAGPRALLEGDRLIREGNYAEAIEKLQTATQLLPEQSQALAWNQLGLAHHRAGHPQLAIAAYQQALRRNHLLAAAHFNLGSLYLEQNDLAAAIPALNTYTLLDRNAFSGWLKLGTAQLRSRQLDAAEKSFQNALQLNAALPEALNGLGIAQLQRKRPQEALKYFNGALQRQSNYGPALLNSGILYHQHLTNLPLALQKYRSYLEVTPQPANVAAVRETIRQIELLMNPPPRVALKIQPDATSPASPPNLAFSTNLVPSTNIAVVRQIPVATVQTNQKTVPQPNRPSKPEQPIALSSSSPSSTPKIPTDPQVQTVKTTNTITTSKLLPEKPIALYNSNLLSKPIIPTDPPLQTVKVTNSIIPKPPLEKPEPPPKIEVVKLTPDLPPKPAQDTPLNPSIAPTNTIASLPEAVRPLVSDPRIAEPVQDSPLPTLLSKKKRTIVEKLNPLTWFRGKGKPAPSATRPERELSVTSILSIPAKPEITIAKNVDPLPTPAPSLSTPALLAPARYRYRFPSKPVAGDREKADPLFAQGVKAHRERRLTAAIEAYREAIKLDRSFFEAHYNLGLAAYDIKNLPQSLSSYEEALSINPTSSNARYNFALALEQAGFIRDAASELEKLLADNPEESRAHFILAKLYADELSQPKLARLHYSKVLALEPQHPDATAIRYWLVAHP